MTLIIIFLKVLNLTPGIIIFDVLVPRAFRKYTTPMVFCEFLKNPNQPQNLGVETLISFVTILNLTPGIIIKLLEYPIPPRARPGCQIQNCKVSQLPNFVVGRVFSKIHKTPWVWYILGKPWVRVHQK